MKKIFVLLGLVLWQFVGLVHGAIPASERAVLITLYNNTDGDNWTNNNGWKTPPLDTDGFAMPGTEGNWFGISVDADHVTGIVLNVNQLNGTIPSSLGNLSQLINLCMVINQLNGTIPPQLGNLSNLHNLSLAENQLSGTIPSQLGNLISLTVLNLGRNQLTGSIPSQLGNLSNLIDLFLYENQLSGAIPSQLSNLSNLQRLVLSSNQLSGTIPAQLSNLSQLKHLLLDYNQLTGNIPSQLGNLAHLEYLYLRNNQLSGTLPSQLGNLITLEELLLCYNQLSGSIPSQLGNLKNLKGLWINDNHLTGLIPSSLTNLVKMIILDIGYNCLSATDSNLRTWLTIHDPNWEAHQNQCGGVIVKPTVTTQSVSSISQTGASCGGNVIAEGVTPVFARGVCWGTEINPTIKCSITTNGTGTGSFTSTITGLNANTLYYVRAYATNNNGTSYGANQSFTTQSSVVAPKVTTQSVSSITQTSAICGGNVTSDGGSSVIARGVCWNTTTNPTINHSKTTDGTGTGSFISNITGLNTNTLYYVRAYATNNNGTSYGANLSFTTLSNLSETTPPFGSFDTPIDSSTVAGSIAVTGWALDDSGVASVKIYINQGNTPTYIGDALFVEGARPDITIAYPEYPANTKAGWGYMMLTNFLPGEGNGTFVLSVVATDLAGKTTELGTKTIIVDNAHAVKPFGAIDTPTQGGTASGSAFINWGWVLTPQPNNIPTSGSTINVWVDGVNKGQPTYNIYRSDIATLFPGYANSNGAIGYFYLDTTKYTNGLHTIQWTATDNAGNTDGIGSRYFTIQNEGADNVQFACKKEFGLDSLPEENGNSRLVIKELERVEIPLGENYMNIQGYLMNGNEVSSLPIGSTLDKKNGTFSWSPGPGFLGSYSLVFVLTDVNGLSVKKAIEIEIEPKYNN